MNDTDHRIKLAAHALLSMQRHSWEHGTAMQAFLEMGDSSTVIAMAHEAVYRRRADGRAAVMGNDEAVTDPCSVGEGLLYACSQTNDPFLKQGKDELLDWALKKAPRNEDGIVYHIITSKQFWVDSVYMLPPFLAAAGYHEEAMKQFWGYTACLYDPEAHLMSHMWDDEARTFIRKAHWGTGNGWTLAAIARLIPMMKEAGRSQDVKKLQELAADLLEHLLTFMREDGLFHDVTDDPSTFVETNLSQMTAYTIYRGLADGWISKDSARGQERKQAADRMRAAANQKMNAYGFISGVCGAPGFDKPGFSPEGQAFYLLMEQAASQII